MPYEYKREPLTQSEVDRLVNACESQRERLVIITLLDTGLREAELVNLKKDNIEWQANRLVIFGKGSKRSKGKSKRRVIPISKRVKQLLENHFLFNNSLGFGVKTLYRDVKEVANRAGIAKPVSPHVLRHTFATVKLQEGVSIKAVSLLLGHADLRTTMIYLNMSNEDAVSEVMSKCEGY